MPFPIGPVIKAKLRLLPFPPGDRWGLLGQCRTGPFRQFTDRTLAPCRAGGLTHVTTCRWTLSAACHKSWLLRAECAMGLL